MPRHSSHSSRERCAQPPAGAAAGSAVVAAGKAKRLYAVSTGSLAQLKRWLACSPGGGIQESCLD